MDGWMDEFVHSYTGIYMRVNIDILILHTHAHTGLGDFV